MPTKQPLSKRVSILELGLHVIVFSNLLQHMQPCLYDREWSQTNIQLRQAN